MISHVTLNERQRQLLWRLVFSLMFVVMPATFSDYRLYDIIHPGMLPKFCFDHSGKYIPEIVYYIYLQTLLQKCTAFDLKTLITLKIILNQDECENVLTF